MLERNAHQLEMLLRDELEWVGEDLPKYEAAVRLAIRYVLKVEDCHSWEDADCPSWVGDLEALADDLKDGGADARQTLARLAEAEAR